MKIEKFRKGKLISGIGAIIFVILNLSYNIFYNKVYGDIYLNMMLYNSKEQMEQFRELFANIKDLTYALFIIILLVINILLFICHKKNNIKIFRKNEIKTKLSNATALILGGSLLFILFGFGWSLPCCIANLFLLIGGILSLIA